ncbi:MAG: D-alanyl-D-alanine carboxypeptidase [Mogibacterium sp.]|nr:D-alanyl-D-alanine carboxypeptidase [Mogibacterium sp.]
MAAVLTALMMLVLMTAIPHQVACAAEGEPTVTAEAAVVMSGSTGEVIWTSHADRKLAPSGTTKLLTAMVVIDRMHDESEYQNVLQITNDIAEHGNVFNPMEKVVVEDLMYALLMENSHEAAETLAVYSAGSEEAFVQEMNAKAAQIGMKNTQYLTSTGRYRDTQYSTVTDTARLMHAALEYPKIVEILSASTHRIPATNKSAVRVLRNDRTVYISGFKAAYAVTMKNPSVADNYIAVAERDGMELVAVLFGADSAAEAKEARELLEYGFKNVTRNEIIDADQKMGSVLIRHGEISSVPVYTASKGYVYVPPEGTDDLIRTETVLFKGITAPVEPGTKAGEYRIYVADKQVGKVDLIIKKNVATGWFPSWIYLSNQMAIIVGAVLGVLLILLIILRILRRRNRKRRAALRQKRIREMAREQQIREEDRRQRNWDF